MLNFASVNQMMEEQVMIAIRKTFSQLSEQMERIFRLYYNGGYGTEKMFRRCEELFLTECEKMGIINII